MLSSKDIAPSFSDMSDSQKMLLISLALNDVQTKLASHDKLLVTGNGSLPMTERLRNIETYISGTKYWSKLVLGAILLQTISFAGAAIVYLIKLYPLLEKLTQATP